MSVDRRLIYQALLERGLSENQAQGILMNLADESSFNPGVLGDNKQSGGLFQHYGPRFKELQRFASARGKPWQDWQTQVDYAMTEPDMRNYLAQNYASPGQAGVGFLDLFERPAKVHRDRRAAKYLGSSGVDVSGTPTQNAASYQTAPQQGAQMATDDFSLADAMAQIQAMQQPQQEISPWEGLLHAGLGILSTPTGTGSPLMGIARGAASGLAGLQQQQPQQMSTLQLLQAGNELYKLREAAGERRRKRRAIEALKQQYPDQAAAIEAGLLGKESYADIAGLGGSESGSQYGTSSNFAQIGTWEDGTPKWVMVRPSTGKAEPDLVPMEKGFEPPRSPEQAGATEEAKAWRRMRPETIANVNQSLMDTQTQLQNTSRLLKEFESGKYDKQTGPLRGLITRWYSPEVAELRMQNINSRLRNLQVTNLAPVSNVEMRLMDALYASPNLTKEQNIQILTSLQRVQSAKVKALQQAMQRLRSESFEEYMLNPVAIDVDETIAAPLEELGISVESGGAGAPAPEAPPGGYTDEDFEGAGPVRVIRK